MIFFLWYKWHNIAQWWETVRARCGSVCCMQWDYQQQSEVIQQVTTDMANNIRGSYQFPASDDHHHSNGAARRSQHQVICIDNLDSRNELMDFGATMKSKVKSLIYEDERDQLLKSIADKRPEIIGGSQSSVVPQVLSRLGLVDHQNSPVTFCPIALFHMPIKINFIIFIKL